MRFEQTVDINASPDQVWNILADVQHWPDWTPTVKSFEWAEGDSLAVGARARLDLDGAGMGTWTVSEVDQGRSFSWTNNTRGVHTVGGHIVEPREGGSRVTLILEQSGLMATLLKPLIARVSKRNLPIEAAGLKRASESLATPVP